MIKTNFTIDDISTLAFSKAVMDTLIRSFPEEDFEQFNTENDLTAIAGGAVAAAVFELLNIDAPICYTDIDLWYKRDDYDTGTFASVKSFNSTITLGYNGNELVSDGYCVVNSIHKGRVNEIHVNSSDIDLIIKGFDINAIQVGINDNGLAFTEAFLEYLRKPELKVVQFCTPASSLIRLLNKERKQGFKLAKDAISRLVEIIKLDLFLINGDNTARANSAALLGYDRAKTLLSLISKKELKQLGLNIAPRGFSLKQHHFVDPYQEKTVCFYQLIALNESTLITNDLRTIKKMCGKFQSLCDLNTRASFREVADRQPGNLNVILAASQNHRMAHGSPYWLEMLKQGDFSDSTHADWEVLHKVAWLFPFINVDQIRETKHIAIAQRNGQWLRDNHSSLVSEIDSNIYSNRSYLKYYPIMLQWPRMESHELKLSTERFGDLVVKRKKANVIAPQVMQEIIDIFPKDSMTEITNEHQLDLLNEETGVFAHFQRLVHSSDIVLRIVTDNEVSAVHLGAIRDEYFIQRLTREERLSVSPRQSVPNDLILSYKILGIYNRKEGNETTDTTKKVAEDVLNLVNQKLTSAISA